MANRPGHKKREKVRIKYRTGDIILLKESSFTHAQAADIGRKMRKVVILMPDVKDFSSISTSDLRRILKMREANNATNRT